MDSNPFFHPPHYSHPYPQSAPLVPPSAYHTPPAVYPGYPGVAFNYGGYDIDWGLERHSLYMHLANQMSTGQPASAGVAVAANNNGSRCKWDSGGTVCNQDCGDFNGLIIHLARVHGVQGSAGHKLVCQWLTESGVCGGRYRRDAFRRHIGTHLGHSILCAVCGKSFSRGDSMRAHAKKEHGK